MSTIEYIDTKLDYISCDLRDLEQSIQILDEGRESLKPVQFKNVLNETRRSLDMQKNQIKNLIKKIDDIKNRG